MTAPNPTPNAKSNRATYGFLAGLLWGNLWLLVEGFFVSAMVVEAPMWASILNPGAGAPFILALAAITATLHSSWPQFRLLNPAKKEIPLNAQIKDWFWGGSPEDKRWRTTCSITALSFFLLWSMLGIAFGIKILGTVVTPGFAAGLILLTQVVLALTLFALSPVLAVPCSRLLHMLERKTQISPSPGQLLLGLFALGLIGFGLSWILYGKVLRHLPWALVIGPVIGAMISVQLLGKMGSKIATYSATLMFFTLALGSFVHFLPTNLSDARSMMVGRNSVASAWVSWLEPKLDFDKDGTSNFFAGGDCAPHNPAISPKKLEIVGNGLDDDCVAGDLKIDPAQYTMGKNHHPRPEGIVKKPHVIFITTDALSFHHTSLSDYPRDTTPHLKEWASRATVYENSFATSSSTRLAFPGMLTGMLNSMVKMNARRIHPYPYDKSVQTMASLFKSLGYRTVHMMGDSYFGKRKWSGYWKGFDTVDEKPYKNAADKGHTAPELTQAALKHIEEESDKPLFLWVHYYDHHEPYETPKRAKKFGNSEVDHYDGELHYADQFWGLLFSEIESRWSPEEYVIAFTSDHGEAFDVNHPREHHDFSLHTEVLHVPLIIQAPWGRGRRISGLTSHLDILPTLADLAGIPTNPKWIGESLIPTLASNKEPEKQVVYSMFYIPEDAKHGRDGFRRFGVRTQDLYYFVNYTRNTHILARWQEDRLEQNNLYQKDPETTALYRFLAADKVNWLREREKGLTHLYRDRKKKTKTSKRGAKDPAPSSSKRKR